MAGPERRRERERGRRTGARGEKTRPIDWRSKIRKDRTTLLLRLGRGRRPGGEEALREEAGRRCRRKVGKKTGREAAGEG